MGQNRLANFCKKCLRPGPAAFSRRALGGSAAPMGNRPSRMSKRCLHRRRALNRECVRRGRLAPLCTPARATSSSLRTACCPWRHNASREGARRLHLFVCTTQSCIAAPCRNRLALSRARLRLPPDAPGRHVTSAARMACVEASHRPKVSCFLTGTWPSFSMLFFLFYCATGLRRGARKSTVLFL